MALFEESVPVYKDWQIPPAMAAEDRRLGFINDSCEEGLAWLRSQRGSQDFRRAFDTISGKDTGIPPADYRSHINPNRLKRNIKEIISAMSKLRPMWGYNSDNSAYRANAEMMNKVTRALYLEQMWDRSIKSALAWASATCAGYVRPRYRRDLAGTGDGNIVLDDYGSPSILPVQLPRDGNIQRAYAVNILDEMPIFEAHAMFPRYQERLRPSSARYWYANDAIRRASQGNWLRRAFGSLRKKGDESSLSDLLIPIRYTYVTDLSINTTDATIPMGDSDAPWHYTVPAFGSDIPTGFDISTRQLTTRKANETDARLYPRRRLIISTDSCIMYDGPSFDWHGMVPLVRFGMDDWPWEPLGFSLVHDGYEINEAIKTLERGFMDKQIAKLDPSLAYDQNAVAMSDARAVDPFMPRGRYGYDGNASEGAPFTPVVPPETLRIDSADMAHLEHLYSILDSQQAVEDAMALAKMRAVGSMDDLEKIMDANGPIIEDMSRSMEPPMRDLGVMIKYLVLQYMNTSRVMQYVGEDGVTAEIMDYDPTRLIPSHMQGEDPGEGATPTPSRFTLLQRAKTFADNLRFFIMPNSLHELTQMQMKLALIQLKKAGIKIDSMTIAESFNIPNYGKIPGSTVLERAQAEAEMDMENMARMKQIAEEVGLAPPPGGGGAPPGAPKPGGGAPEGRPSSFNAPPELKSKDGGTRSTITTSR
jgi:hypothetical protein